jgi:hypothetical protein
MSTQSDQGRDQATRRVIQGLKNIYKSTILPLEQVRRGARELEIQGDHEHQSN